LLQDSSGSDEPALSSILGTDDGGYFPRRANNHDPHALDQLLYLIVAASVLASNTVGRSAVVAGFPLFAVQMFDKLGPQWASTLLGGVACVMIPVPFWLARYGK